MYEFDLRTMEASVIGSSKKMPLVRLPPDDQLGSAIGLGVHVDYLALVGTCDPTEIDHLKQTFSIPRVTARPHASLRTAATPVASIDQHGPSSNSILAAADNVSPAAVVTTADALLESSPITAAATTHDPSLDQPAGVRPTLSQTEPREEKKREEKVPLFTELDLSTCCWLLAR